MLKMEINNIFLLQTINEIEVSRHLECDLSYFTLLT